jgi:hypothetical protein
MSFDQLSNETLFEIVYWVEQTSATTTMSLRTRSVTEAGPRWLTGFARCSKRFNSLATPLLYYSFTENYMQGGKVRLALFLRTVLRKPELGMLMTRLSLYCSSGIIRDDRLDIRGSGVFDEDDIARCRAVVETLEDSNDEAEKIEDFTEEIRRGICFSLAGILVASLPNLEQVRLNYYGWDNDYLVRLEGVFEQAAKLQSLGTNPQCLWDASNQSHSATTTAIYVSPFEIY